MTAILIALLSFQLFSATPLVFEKIFFNQDEIEVSGLYHDGKDLLFVGDKLSNRAIYKVNFDKTRFSYTKYIDLKNMKGHNTYFTNVLAFSQNGKVIKSPFDFEGLTACGSTFYIVNEQVRHIVKITKSSLTNLNLEFQKFFKKIKYPLSSIPRNAGFEGLTADCKNQKLYIAQERDPRGIIVVDLKKNEVEKSFLFSDEKKKGISRSFSAIHYENENLYMLERLEHRILKYNLKLQKVISEVSFDQLKNINLKEVYKTEEKYGLVEGLSMTKNHIYLGVDNNKNPLSKKAETQYNLKGNFSSILLFKRPKGF